MTRSEKPKKIIGSAWNLLVRFNRWSYKPIGLLLILIAAWWGFLKLVKIPPLDTTPVLVMIWITAIILLLGLFPEILDRIKKIKIGDFEFELQEAVKTSISRDFVTIENIRHAYTHEQKGGASALQNLISQAMQSPQDPVVLIVNINRRISKPFLFVYLFLLDLLLSNECEAIVVLFVSSQRSIKAVSDITVGEFIGITSAKDVLNVFYVNFPFLIDFFRLSLFRSNQGETQQSIFINKGFSLVPSESFILSFIDFAKHQMRVIPDDFVRDNEQQENEQWQYFTRDELINWFTNILDKRFIESSIRDVDIKAIYERIAQGDKYMLIADGIEVKSILFLCDFGRNITSKLLKQLSETKR